MDRTDKIILWLSVSAFLLGTAAFMYGTQIKEGAFKKMSKFKRKLIEIAHSEYDQWNPKSGKIKEGDERTMKNLRKYWQEGTNVTSWDDKRMVREAWSAAAISWLMKMAGAGDKFKYSTSHSVYIRDSIKNRKAKNDNPFKGYRPEEVSVEVGDLVCYARTSGVGYDTTSSYPSHCDLVVKTEEGNAITYGGNVSNSFTRTDVALDKDGKVTNKKKYFVVIKNNL